MFVARIASMGVVATLTAVLGMVGRSAVGMGGHCAGHATVTPVEGARGFFLIVTDHGRTIARTPPVPTGTPDYIINAEDHTWDADSNALTVIDTLVVPAGATVRWHLAAGIHTLTNGHDSGDPTAGTKFDFLMDKAHPDFDSTFVSPDTIDFFCYFHEPDMLGTLIVSSTITPTRPLTWGELKQRFR